jgi:hypothetical protein
MKGEAGRGCRGLASRLDLQTIVPLLPPAWVVVSSLAGYDSPSVIDDG